MQHAKNECKKFSLKGLKIFWNKHYQEIAAYIAAFMLLFLGGLRFNPTTALLISLLDTAWIILLSTLLNWIFRRKTFKFRPLSIIALTVLLFLFIHILFSLEYYIWIPLFFENTSVKLPGLFFKDTLIVLGSFIAALISYSNRQRKQAEKLSFEKQAMELRFLKSQIKPHFIFNVLNNIYTLAYTKSDQAPEAILKLADMLRYVTDECQSDSISIEKELKYVENFIDLQILKIGHSDNITFEFDIDDYSVRIPPMILQPIIENSFKYGDIDTNRNGVIFFGLKIKDKQLFFEAFNTKKRIVPHVQTTERQGVGISNVVQRLQLYYRKSYDINIEEEDSSYRIKVYIDLSKIDKQNHE